MITQDLVGNQCAIVYTDFVSDVAPILCTVIECAGYYGEMDADTHQLAQDEWMQGNVQGGAPERGDPPEGGVGDAPDHSSSTCRRLGDRGF